MAQIAQEQDMCSAFCEGEDPNKGTVTSFMLTMLLTFFSTMLFIGGLVMVKAPDCDSGIANTDCGPPGEDGNPWSDVYRGRLELAWQGWIIWAILIHFVILYRIKSSGQILSRRGDLFKTLTACGLTLTFNIALYVFSFFAFEENLYIRMALLSGASYFVMLAAALKAFFPGFEKRDDVCAMCMEPPKHPAKLKCGHVFCAECLVQLRHSEHTKCPLCRKEDKFLDPNRVRGQGRRHDSDSEDEDEDRRGSNV